MPLQSNVRTLPWYARPWVVDGWRNAKRYPIIPIAILMFLLVLPAIFAPVVAPHDPYMGSLSNRLTPPFWQEGGTLEYPLGTDKLGRDMLSRIIYGARISLTVSLIAIVVGGVIGTLLGLASGYFGRMTDAVIMRLVDISLSLPTILLALVLVAAVGPSFGTVVTVLIVLLWARYARLVRGEVLALKERDFIARARVAGASHARIMYRYLFPNVVNSLIVLATLQVGYVILLESALSFLGAGLPRAEPAWGVMVADGRELIVTAWWVSMFPGLAIMLTVLALNLLGDWLRDHYDPKLRNL
jgi:peptide/nickel transport system permease protein